MERHQRVLNAVESGLSTVVDISMEAYANTPDAHPGLAQDQTLAHLLSHERSGRVQQTGQGWISGEN